jgi:hypothetical protein
MKENAPNVTSWICSNVFVERFKRKDRVDLEFGVRRIYVRNSAVIKYVENNLDVEIIFVRGNVMKDLVVNVIEFPLKKIYVVVERVKFKDSNELCVLILCLFVEKCAINFYHAKCTNVQKPVTMGLVDLVSTQLRSRAYVEEMLYQ